MRSTLQAINAEQAVRKYESSRSAADAAAADPVLSPPPPPPPPPPPCPAAVALFCSGHSVDGGGSKCTRCHNSSTKAGRTRWLSTPCHPLVSLSR
eukprot:7062444-Pyramimonas_sp.AAC.1